MKMGEPLAVCRLGVPGYPRAPPQRHGRDGPAGQGPSGDGQWGEASMTSENAISPSMTDVLEESRKEDNDAWYAFSR